MAFRGILAIGFLMFVPAIFCVGATSNSSSFQLTESNFSPSYYSTSASFKLNSAISQISIGPSLITDFNLKGGWLYFPIISTPVVSATAGDAQVALSWTAAVGELGWDVGSYNVGWGTTSGGPYTSISAGLSTSYTKTSLSNGTTYYFVIIVKDKLGTGIATSTEVSATPVATPVTPPATPGGGGTSGGGTIGVFPTGTARATFRGRAYPLSDVSLLRDGQFVAKTKSGPDAIFEISVFGLAAGQYNFGVNAIDSAGYQSLTQTFPVTLTDGAGVLISGVFIAPSIAVDKMEVKKGDNLAIFGRSTPSSQIVISINSAKEIFAQIASDKSGAYLYNLDTVQLEMGGHTAKSKAAVLGEISPFGQSAGFLVGTKNVWQEFKPRGPTKADLNGDYRVNLVDFSIAAYWYKRPLTGLIIPKEKEQLNGDAKIDLVDFSIMAYYWTG